jgi:hypothetical protein
MHFSQPFSNFEPNCNKIGRIHLFAVCSSQKLKSLFSGWRREEELTSEEDGESTVKKRVQL